MVQRTSGLCRCDQHLIGRIAALLGADAFSLSVEDGPFIEGAGSGTSLHPNILVMELVSWLATNSKIVADQVELFVFVLGQPVAPSLDLLAILERTGQHPVPLIR